MIINIFILWDNLFGINMIILQTFLIILFNVHHFHYLFDLAAQFQLFLLKYLQNFFTILRICIIILILNISVLNIIIKTPNNKIHKHKLKIQITSKADKSNQILNSKPNIVKSSFLNYFRC